MEAANIKAAKFRVAYLARHGDKWKKSKSAYEVHVLPAMTSIIVKNETAGRVEVFISRERLAHQWATLIATQHGAKRTIISFRVPKANHNMIRICT